MNSGLQGRHVLVTGAARGIGLAIAQAFAHEQAHLTLLDCHAENLLRTVESLRRTGVPVEGREVDVSDPEAVRVAVLEAEARAPIEVLVNDAGIAFETAFLDIELEEWRRVLEVNLTGMFLVSQAVARHMAARRRGVILNMASKNGIDGEAGYAHYNASKAGVILLTQTMALELGHLGVRINAVAPGYLQTPMSEAIDSAAFVADFIERYIPLGRSGRVGDVAPLFVFLASDAASFISGQTFVLDGGQLAGQKPSRELLERLYPPARGR
ncbi:MAG TPA: SDR family NAD(P)-dependent oxidoreductase [Steroidobacteraceae bacterium]|nr:SDR family NAD(P)-dependent oxidoreductase [Steroidobacteraceae bacterium]